MQKQHQESDYYLNFDDERLLQFETKDFQMLIELFVELFGRQSTFYFDEIQNIRGWELFVRRLYEQGHKILITGSNANLLSQELGTHLTGRYIQFEIYPLSFKEILYHQHKEILSKATLSSEEVGLILHHFSLYLSYGGIPDYVLFKKREYIQSLCESILYRDIVSRYRISRQHSLRELVFYFASNIGKEFS